MISIHLHDWHLLTFLLLQMSDVLVYTAGFYMFVCHYSCTVCILQMYQFILQGCTCLYVITAVQSVYYRCISLYCRVVHVCMSLQLYSLYTTDVSACIAGFYMFVCHYSCTVCILQMYQLVLQGCTCLYVITAVQSVYYRCISLYCRVLHVCMSLQLYSLYTTDVSAYTAGLYMFVCHYSCTVCILQVYQLILQGFTCLYVITVVQSVYYRCISLYCRVLHVHGCTICVL